MSNKLNKLNNKLNELIKLTCKMYHNIITHLPKPRLKNGTRSILICLEVGILMSN